MKARPLLAFSLLLNAAIVVLAIGFATRKGGVSYLNSKIHGLPQRTIPPVYETPLYHNRLSFFESLPASPTPLVFAGDSLTDYCEWDELLQRPALNRGIAADSVEGVRLRMDEILRHRPTQLFLMIGANDMMADVSVDAQLEGFEKIIKSVRTGSPQTKLYLESLLPTNVTLRAKALGLPFPPHFAGNIETLNKKLKAEADEKHIFYVDIYSRVVTTGKQLNPRYTWDGLHLNGEGYKQWREAILPYLDSK